MKNKPKIEYPASNICMDCPHGQFVNLEDKPSCYICHWDSTASVESLPMDCPENIPSLSEWKEVFRVNP